MLDLNEPPYSNCRWCLKLLMMLVQQPSQGCVEVKGHSNGMPQVTWLGDSVQLQ